MCQFYSIPPPSSSCHHHHHSISQSMILSLFDWKIWLKDKVFLALASTSSSARSTIQYHHHNHHCTASPSSSFTSILQYSFLIFIIILQLFLQPCHCYNNNDPHHHHYSSIYQHQRAATTLSSSNNTFLKPIWVTTQLNIVEDPPSTSFLLMKNKHKKIITLKSKTEFKNESKLMVNDGDDYNSTISRPKRVIRSVYQIYHQTNHISQPITLSQHNYELHTQHQSSSSSNNFGSIMDLGLNFNHNPYFCPQLPYKPYFIQEPYGRIQFSNLYGQILPCQIGFRKLDQISRSMMMTIDTINTGGDVVGESSIPPSPEDLIEKIYWEVRDERGSLMGINNNEHDQYVPVVDVPGIREHRPNDGSLAFMPFTALDSPGLSLSGIAGELHNSLYRCVGVLRAGLGRIVSRSILVNVVFEKSSSSSSSPSSTISSTGSSVAIRAYDTTVTDGNDALMKCTTNSELYQIIAWITDDEDIILPLEQQQLSSSSTNGRGVGTTEQFYSKQILVNTGASSTYIPSDTRYYVLPSGDLLIAAVRSSDLRRQFRCRAQHQITGERMDSSNWARIKLRDQSSHISYRPRFNLDASLRRTLVIEDDDGNSDNEENINQNQNRPSPPIDIYCSFDAQPPPNLTWYFVSYFDSVKHHRLGDAIQYLEPLSMDDGHSSMLPHLQPHYTLTTRHLRINQPSIRDVGTYICVANNSHFQVRHETDLLSKRSLRLNMTMLRNDPNDSGSSSADLGPFLPGDTITLYCNLTNFLTAFDLPLTPPITNQRQHASISDSDGSNVDNVNDDIDNNDSNNPRTETDWIKILNQVLQNRFTINYYWYHNQVPIIGNNVNSDLMDHFNDNSNNKRNNGASSGGGSNSKSSRNRMIQQPQPQQQQHYETLTQNVLRINQLEYSDSGLYQCFARITGGPDFEQWLQSSKMVIIRQSPPRFQQTFNEQILMNQQELSLKCIANGIPAPIIQWQRNQINLTDPIGNLINIQSLSSSSTSASSSSNQNHLYRYKTSTFQQKLSSSSSTNNNHYSPSLTITKNGPINSVTGNRGSTASKSDHQQLFQTISYLNISSLRPQDVGQFGCLAWNRAGTILHQARIGVIGSPYVHPITDRTAVVGQSLTIQCAYSGYPIEEVYFVKSKRRLPFDERHLVGGTGGGGGSSSSSSSQQLQMGQLTITQVDKSDDGEYFCVVVGENGQRAQQSFRIITVLPPVLSPFLFSDALEEGTRATAVCSVISGDPPITLQWLKDGQPLLSPHTRPIDPHIQVLNIKEFISSLIITNITRRHQGVYTCLATTPNTSTNRTAVMRVKAPPKWLIKPSNKIAITLNSANNPLISMDSSSSSSSSLLQYNQNVRFDCLASGNPTPVIRWKFLRLKRTSTGNIGNSNNNRNHHQETAMESIPILSSPQIHVLENGSLLIRSIDKSKFEGIYLCEVSNGVGKPLEARATLQIYQTPLVQIKVVPHGDSSSMQHKLPSSSSPNSIHHQQDHNTHQTNDQLMVIQMAIRHHSQVSLSCTGTGTVPLFIGWYKNGREINVYDSGSVTSTTSFRIFEPAGKSSNGGKSDLNRQLGERSSNLMLKHVGRSDSAQYVCMARNAYGQTHRMVVLHVLEPPDPPEQLKAIEVGSRTVTLTWTIGYTGNMPLLSQNIEYKKEADKTWHNAMMIKSNTNTVTIHGLQPLQPYEFRVSFVNELGPSEHSRSITLTTQMEAPTVMPDNVRALPLSTHSIRLTWSIRVPPQQQQASAVPSATTSGIAASSSSSLDTSVIGSSATDIEIIDGFYIGYRALPESSSSPSSASSSTSNTNNQVLSTGGNHQSSSSSLPSYTYKTISNTPMQPLYSKMMTPSSSLSSSSTQWKTSNNQNRANKHQNSFMMKLNQSMMMDTMDSVGSGSGLLMMSSSSSSSSSSMPFHQYYEHVIDTLQRHTLYQFIVQAFNEKGAGPSSIEITARTFAHDPPRPPNFRIENVSTHEALLSWDYDSLMMNRDSIYLTGSSSSAALIGDQDQDPLLVDGFVISYHLAQNYVIDDSNIGEDWQSVTISSASTSSFMLRNLRCGSEYVTRIEAFNEMGSGRPSEMVRFSTLGSPPIPPDKYSNNFIISNITFVIINLDLWSDGGCPITGYSIKYRTRRSIHYHRNQATVNGNGNNGGGWITLSTHLMPEKEKLIVRDLPAGTWHDLIIAAQNDAGKREAEYSFATLTETGATVEPLHAYESRMATNLGSGSISIVGALFDDPMIFIPAICTVIVLIVVISTSVFLYIMRLRQEQLQMAGDDTYCSHRSSTRLDEMSLSSYPNSNGTCKKSPASAAAATAIALNSKLNGKIHLAYEKNGSVIAAASKETEPLYEQTNFAASAANGGSGIQMTNIKAATFHKSPHHHHQPPVPQQPSQQQQQMKTMDDSNLLMETIDLSSNTNNQQSALDQSNESYSFEPIFDHRDPVMGQYFKTLQQNRAANQAAAFHHHANSSSISSSSNTCHSSSHLYQMPEQVKQQQQQREQEIAMALKSREMIQNNENNGLMIGEDCPIKTTGQQSQPQQQHCQLIQKPSLPNAYMTTFGIVRPQ